MTFFSRIQGDFFCPNMNQLENLKCGWMIVVLMICTVYLLTTKHHLRKFKCCSSCLLLFAFKWPKSDKSSQENEINTKMEAYSFQKTAWQTSHTMLQHVENLVLFCCCITMRLLQTFFLLTHNGACETATLS